MRYAYASLPFREALSITFASTGDTTLKCRTPLGIPKSVLRSRVYSSDEIMKASQERRLGRDQVAWSSVAAGSSFDRPRIKALLIDAAGTLITPSEPIAKVLTPQRPFPALHTRNARRQDLFNCCEWSCQAEQQLQQSLCRCILSMQNRTGAG